MSWPELYTGIGESFDDIKRKIKDLYYQYLLLKKENEQLKKELEEYRKIETENHKEGSVKSIKMLFSFVALACLFFVSESPAQTDMSPTIQPYCAYQTADSLFNNADSSFRTRLSNGVAVNAYWLRVRRSAGLDSAVVMVHLTRNTLDTVTPYPIYIQEQDLGRELGYLFNKIYKIGTTPGVLDSLFDWGPKLNLDNYKW